MPPLLALALALALASTALLAACDRDRPRDERQLTDDGSVDVPDVVHRTSIHMSTVFTITVAGDDAALLAIEAAFAELERVEQAISNWRDDSDASRLNRAAGRAPVVVGPDLLALAQVAHEVSELTSGAFDLTFAACGDLWSTDPPRIPTDAEVATCLPDVDYRLLEIDPERSTLRLTRAGSRIGVGAIGKGFGLDRAAQVLRSHGFEDFVIEGGGDLVAAGTRYGEPWRVGVQAPRGTRGQLLGALVLPPEGLAVATSGDYERYFETPEGERVHHLIDPRTGRVARGAVAVTVLARDATHADALATGVLVLGPEAGLALVETLDGVEALFVDEAGEAHLSSGFDRFVGPLATTSQ